MQDPRSWARAIFPLAIAPPALALALLFPAPFDPGAPLETCPPWIVLLLFVAAAAPLAAVFTARRAIADSRERSRLLLSAGALAFAATALTAAIAFALAPPLLVRGGGVWILLAAAATAVPLVAAFVALEPLRFFRWGLLAGECVIALACAYALRDPRGPDEYLRHVMLVAPGYGPSTLAVVLPRQLPGLEDHDRRYESRLRAIDATIAAMIESGAFAEPFVRWGDDARTLRATVALRAAASPSMSKEDERDYLHVSVSERMLFAASPESRLEPWTARGILPMYALIETEGLAASDETRVRVHAAWDAVVVLATRLEDPALEKETIGLVRKLFADNRLDRAHHIHLATFALERRRLVEAGDAPALLAFFDALATEDFPDELKKSFAREAAFLRENAGDDHAPVIALLRARLLANGGDGDLDAAREVYHRIVETWPASSVAPIATAEMRELGAAP